MSGSRCSLLVMVTALVVAGQAHGQSLRTKNPLSLVESKRAKVEWDLNMGAGYANEGKDDGALVYLYGGLNADLNFHKILSARLEPRIRFFEGRDQARYDDDLMSNRFMVQNMYLALKPIEIFEFRAGAHSQRETGSNLLVSNLRSFIGFKEIAKWKMERMEARLVAQQVIPSSHSTNTERAEKEPMPSFRTEALEFEGQLTNFSWKATAGLFQWRNIPSKVVYESRIKGNEGTGDLVPGSRFRFEHQGWYSAGTFCWCPESANFGVVGEFQRFKNVRAPENASDGQLVGVGPKFIFGERELNLRVRSYFTESDATVAVYSRSRFGFMNRQGTNIEASLAFKDLGFSVYAESYTAGTINSDPNQRDMQEYYLGVETDHATF